MEEKACVHFPDCGGCLYQDIGYEEQLRKKETELQELLAGAGAGTCVWEGFYASPLIYGYRAKMEYTFGDSCKDGPLALGMHRRRSRFDIVTADDCRIVHPDFNRILRATLDYFSEQGTPFYHKMRHAGFLRHLVIRRGERSGEILTDLVTTGDPDRKELVDGWAERIRGLSPEGKIVGILHTVNDSPADAVIDQGTEILYGHDFFYEELMGLKFRITPFSFFQNNTRGAEILYGKVREYIGDVRGKTVFDLYCGTGTIAQIAAASAGKTVGVEIVPEAVRAAEQNARENGIANCEFIAGDVLKTLDTIPEKPDVIVLDPPREGVLPKALQKILTYGVKNIIYVSCKPSSFVRDLAVFRGSGYELQKACGVDMFPFTKNAELVAMLVREEENKAS